MEEVMKGGAVPALQMTCPMVAGQAPDREPAFGAYMEVIRRVACARSLPMIDKGRFWRERASHSTYWMSDAFHPGEYGHRAFAECLHRELGIFDPALPELVKKHGRY
jgi:hypothetical protein